MKLGSTDGIRIQTMLNAIMPNLYDRQLSPAVMQTMIDLANAAHHGAGGGLNGVNIWEQFNCVARCRVCGCTDHDCDHCQEQTGGPCSWIKPNLCSACDPAIAAAAPKKKKKQQQRKYRSTKTLLR